MAQDPYGFKEQVAPAGDPSRAMWNGVIATICASVGMCACYVPYFIGAPLGLYAAWTANQALQVATDPRDRALATAGLVSGLVGGLVCLAWATFIAIYALIIVLYMVIGFFAIFAAAASGGG